jgi:preprotein translocase subunit SecE
VADARSGDVVTDLLMILVTVAFFGFAFALVRWFDRI